MTPEYVAAKHILNKKAELPHYKYLKVEGGSANATNGHVLITFDTNLKDGNYLPVRITKKQVEWVKVDESFDYPDIESLYGHDFPDYFTWVYTKQSVLGLFGKHTQKIISSDFLFMFDLSIDDIAYNNNMALLTGQDYKALILFMKG